MLMMNVINTVRFVHTATTFGAINKSLLATLRKKTGFTFANCRKALEVNENDLGKATTWLNEQAAMLGWAKAEKLSARRATQGLVAATSSKTKAVLIELNCETDFVARNEKFYSLAELVALTCMNYPSLQTEQQYSKVCLVTDDLKNLKAKDGKTLGDHMALTIGSIGENIVIRRGIIYSVSSNNHIGTYTHPPVKPAKILFGKYGSIVIFTRNKEESLEPDRLSEISQKLCQHVIAMNPIKIGNPEEDKPLEEVEDERIMIHQEFLSDPLITVSQYLQDTGVTVIDYARIECGEKEQVETEKIAAKEN